MLSSLVPQDHPEEAGQKAGPDKRFFQRLLSNRVYNIHTQEQALPPTASGNLFSNFLSFFFIYCASTLPKQQLY